MLVSLSNLQAPVEQDQVGSGCLYLRQQALGLGSLAHHARPLLLLQQQPQS